MAISGNLGCDRSGLNSWKQIFKLNLGDWRIKAEGDVNEDRRLSTSLIRHYLIQPGIQTSASLKGHE